MLGQPLDFAVQLRLEPGEALSAECVGAEVHLGERRVAPTQVRTSLEMLAPDMARVRIATAQAVDEPVVSVAISAGCTSRITKRFVVFADPPLSTVAQAAYPAALAPVEVVAAPTMGSNLAAESTASAVATEPPAAGLGRSVARPGAATAPRRGQRALVSGSNAPRAATAAATSRSNERRASARNARNEARKAVTVRRAAAPAPEPAPRLTLEAEPPPPSAEALAVERALEAVVQAASAARAAASAASASDARIASLEATVAELRAEAKGQRDLATLLRDRLARAEDGGRWFWPLIVLVLLIAAVALWMARRIGALRQERAAGWRGAVSAPEPAPTLPVGAATRPAGPMSEPVPTFTNSELLARPTQPGQQFISPDEAWAAPTLNEAAAVAAAAVADASAPAVPAPSTREAPDGAERAMDQTDIFPRNPNHAPRDVSIEELIDLEQQAEFFVVLGQDEAAIDLLVEHLRNTGGGSPLPYLKLLEIHRRRGDRADYERTRARFNHRFNAYAPDWGIDLASGRTLEDYPGVIPRLQQVWARPLDAMAELEALLFRKSRGELFDLPAYRDVLFLYALARDLLDREAADTGSVDLLLPMADGGDFSSTAPAPFLRQDGDSAPGDFDDRPTVPVDLDLSADLDRPSSIFDPIEQPPTPPRRR